MDDPADRFRDGVGNLGLGQGDLARDSTSDVAAANVSKGLIAPGTATGGANFHLHPLGSALADQEIVVSANV